MRFMIVMTRDTKIEDWLYLQREYQGRRKS